jgi:hypothetical protein
MNDQQSTATKSSWLNLLSGLRKAGVGGTARGPRFGAARGRRTNRMVRLAGEALEPRLVMSSSIPANDRTWTPIGPSPIQNAAPQVTGSTNPDANNVTGMVNSVSVDPNNPNIVYLGSPGGGVWKSTDGGTTWNNLTDFAQAAVAVGANADGVMDINGNQLGPEFRTQFIGAMSVSKSNPNIIYAGTGAVSLATNNYYGRGILKSTDAGQTWTLIRGRDVTPDVAPDFSTGFAGYDNDGSMIFDRRGITRVVIDPEDPNIVYVTTMQSSASNGGNGFLEEDDEGESEFIPLGQRGRGGVYKSRDGGVTWENMTVQPQPVINGQVTSQPLSEFFDYVDLVISPSDKNVLYTAINNFQGSDTGVYRSTDGGIRWFRLSDHPTGQLVGRIRLAVAPTNSNIVYSLISTPGGGDAYLLMKSVNGGITWQNTAPIPTGNLSNFEDTTDHGGGQYAAAIIVDPNDADVVYVGGQRLLRSGDGGFNWTDVTAGTGVSALTPVRELLWDASGPSARLLIASDSGLRRLTFDAGTQAASVENLNRGGLNITQTRDVSLNRFDENLVYASSWHTGTARFNDDNWQQVDSGDGGTIVVDHSNPNNVYRSYRNRATNSVEVFKSTNAGVTFTQIFSAAMANDQGVDPLRYSPLVMDPGNSQRLLLGLDRIFETTDGGANWRTVTEIPTGYPGTQPTLFNNPVVNYRWDADGRILALGASTNRDVVYAVVLGEWTQGPTPGRSTPKPEWFQPRLFVSTVQGGRYYFWNEITQFLPFTVQGLTPYSMRVDPQDPRTVYLVYNYFSNGALTGKVIRVNNSNTGNPQVIDLTNNLPDAPVWTLDVDPRQFGPADDIIYIGTDIGVFTAKANLNTLTPWVRFGEGLPYASVRDLQLSKDSNILYAAIYGRGVWQIRPNATPTLTTVDQTLVTPEDTALLINYNDIASRADEFDRNGDALSFVVDQVFNGTLEFQTSPGTFIPVTPGSTRLEFNSASSIWRWTPPANQNNLTNGGAFLAFSIRASDLELKSAPAVPVFIGVTPVNDPPVFATSPLLLTAGPNSTNPGRDYSFSELIGLLVPSDIELDAVSILIDQISNPLPPGVTLFRNNDATPLAVGQQIGPGDVLRIKTTGLSIGTRLNDVLRIRAIDNGSPAPATSVAQTEVDLLIQNSAPTLTAVNSALLPGGTEDTSYQLDFNQLTMAANEGDVDGDFVSFRITGLSGGTLRRNGVVVNPTAASPVSFGPGDTLTWQPTADANNLVVGNLVPFIMVRAFDSVLSSGTDVLVRVSLAPAPDAPRIPAQSTLLGAARNRPFDIPYAKLLAESGANDPDLVNGFDPITQQPLRFIIRNVDNGTLLVNGSPVVIGQLVGPGDTLTWSSPTAVTGVVPGFTVQVWDGDALLQNGNLSVNNCQLLIDSRNDRPLLTRINTLTAAVEDIGFQIPFNTLFNASDATDSNSDPLTFRIEEVTNGTLTLGGVPVVPGQTLFQPGQMLGWFGPNDANGLIDAFKVSAFDGELGSTPPVQVRISVAPVNDAPRFLANRTFENGVIGNSYATSFADLQNALGLTDVDSPTFTIRVESVLTGTLLKNGVPVTAGTTTLSPNEVFVYIPPVTASGVVAGYTITASDGSARSVSATVNFNFFLGRFYRSFNPNADYHFFTTSRNEFEVTVRNGLRDETSQNAGVAVFLSAGTNITAIHRLRNPNTGRHYYTANTGERDFLIARKWIYEKDEGFVSTVQQPGMIPVNRMYNNNSGVHLYVESDSQRDAILARYPGIWESHGILGFGFPVPGGTILSPVAGGVPTGGSGGGSTGGGGSSQRATAASSVADQGLVAVTSATGGTTNGSTTTDSTVGGRSATAVSRSATSTPSVVDDFWRQVGVGLGSGLASDLDDSVLGG